MKHAALFAGVVYVKKQNKNKLATDFCYSAVVYVM